MALSSFEEDVQAIVVDNGSGAIKVGFAGDDSPRCVHNNAYGIPKHQRAMVGMGNHTYAGYWVDEPSGLLIYQRPVQHGIICNWDAMEKIWAFTFDELRIKPEEHPFLMTEAVLNPKQNRECMAATMFEKFGVPSLYISNPGTLDVYASGRNTAMVLGIGQGVIFTLPVTNGYTLRNAIQRYDFGGITLTEHLMKLLSNQGIALHSTSDREIVDRMKINHCYVALDYEAEVARSKWSPELTETYELPDRSVVDLNQERFECGEILFQPSIAGVEHCDGVHKFIDSAISRCDIDLRSMFYSNMLLSGGSTLFRGLPERLEKEISRMRPSMAVRCVAPPERKYSTWIGGSILASLSTFQNMWVAKAEFDEYGPSIMYRKCF